MKNINKLLFVSLGLLLTGCDINQSLETSETPITEDITNSEVIEENSKLDSDTNQEYITFDNPKKIYINPSVQYTNLYADGLGNEGEHMNCISNKLVSMLNEYTNLIVYSNSSLPGKSLSESVKESNSLDVDYHISLHSNAGGGKGSEGFYTRSSYELTKSILDSMQQVLPYESRGAKYGENSLYELKRTTSSACLIEILFHDDKNQALFIINNQKEIAKAIFDGIVSYLS